MVIIMTPQEVSEALQGRSRSEVARATGISRITVAKIMRGDNVAQTQYATLRTLHEFLLDAEPVRVGC